MTASIDAPGDNTRETRCDEPENECACGDFIFGRQVCAACQEWQDEYDDSDAEEPTYDGKYRRTR